jgi:hypothetical protein
LERIENLLHEYEKLNVSYNNIKVMVAQLVIDEARLDEQMNSVRYQITVQEQKIREINKILRNWEDDPSKLPKGEKYGR